MLRFLFSVFLLLPFSLSFGQTDHQEHQVKIKRSHIFDPGEYRPDFNAQLWHMEAPAPDGKSYRSFLMRQKIESRKQYPLVKQAPEKKIKKTTVPQPLTGHGFNLTYRFNFGRVIDYSGGIPNDNSLAVSNDGIVIAAVNSAIWAYDQKGDSALFSRNHIYSLALIAGDLGSNHVYDPKLIYDEHADRFVLVFLRSNTPEQSAILVAFSSTNNPVDPWYVYEIPGNPLDNNRWTDFPAINITKDELFITGNLIIPNEPWQVGFDGSVIWQIDKNAGYNNDSVLPNKLYSDIRFDGKYTRNIHPVRGTGSTTSMQYFLSNRNFDITNDTVFLMEINGTLDDPETELKIGMGKTSPNYGVPPNGRQQDTDLNDPTKGLQTNDARVLGAITNGEWIQYVANTVNPETGFSAVYHGFIHNPGQPDQKITGTILGDDVLDLGYPNIAYTGNEACDVEAIIGVNFTSPTDFPGVGAFYFGNDSSHSEFLRIKEGENYVDKHQDSYERWGDYFGIQPRFNEPGKVWIAGFYGMEDNRSGTWVNELSTPDSSMLMVHAAETGKSVFCDGQLHLHTSGGIPPYYYSFNGDSATEANFKNDICDGDTLFYTVTDTRGCSISDTLFAEELVASSEDGVYPNPFYGEVVSQFRLDRSQQVTAYLYDMNGKVVAKVIDTIGKEGLNEFHFNLSPLSQGTYLLRVFADESEVLVEKMVKHE